MVTIKGSSSSSFESDIQAAREALDKAKTVLEAKIVEQIQHILNPSELPDIEISERLKSLSRQLNELEEQSKWLEELPDSVEKIHVKSIYEMAKRYKGSE